jgi:BclA-like protein
VHDAGTSTFLINNAGRYLVSFSVTGVEPNQMAVFDNGALVPGSTYGVASGTVQNSGQVILTAAAGDTVTIRNHSSNGAVTLQTGAGGTAANVNASVTIQALG